MAVVGVLGRSSMFVIFFLGLEGVILGLVIFVWRRVYRRGFFVEVVVGGWIGLEVILGV